MTLTTDRPGYRCSLEAELLFAHLKELAMLIGLDGDTELHGHRFDAWGLPDVRAADGSDLGHKHRLLWIDAQCALQEMAEDDADTAAILRARLEAAAVMASGEFTGWRRFADAVYERHDGACLYERYDRGRERLFHAINGDVGEPMECGCAMT